MNIGIIVHSHTGNTLSVAKLVADKLQKAGHSASIEHLKIKGGEQTNVYQFEFEKLPDVSIYEALIFAGPVRAFSISPVIKAYMSGLPGQNGKRTALLVTQQFPKPWMGGSHAIKQMKKIAEQKGCKVCGTGIVNWSNKEREKMIADRAGFLCGLFN